MAAVDNVDNVDIDPELEELYMPSKWVVRVPTEQAVPLHVQVQHRNGSLLE